MLPYTGLAAIYDRLSDDFDHEKWAQYYLKRIAERGVTPKLACDCACGTGRLTIPLAQRGIRMLGVDRSGEMLNEAAKAARRAGVMVQWVRQDMTKLSLPRPVDAVTCCCDGVNYLTDESGARQFFRQAAKALKPGGVLVFDVSTLHKLRDVLGNGFFGEEREDTAYLWSNDWDENTRLLRMDITFFQREEDGRYRRFQETHVQRAHTAQELSEWLEESGFCDVRLYGDQSDAAPTEADLRMHISAIRTKEDIS